jgi:hypothetical protein
MGKKRRSKNRKSVGLSTRISSALVFIAMFFSMLFPIVPQMASAASTSNYTIKWYAADPAHYAKVSPSNVTYPLSGRQDNPLPHAVCFNSSGNLDAVTSLTPQDMVLGQVVPFEIEISVNGSTTPSPISIKPYWQTKTTSGGDFGFDPNYKVIAAFVDTGDAGTNDPLHNATAHFSSNVTGAGTNDEQIESDITVSGLDVGDNVIVEVWVVLKSTIASSVSGNVQTGIISAAETDGDTINTGNQTIPLKKVDGFLTEPKPALTLDKQGVWEDGNNNGYPDVGEVINYTFTVNNTGNVPLTEVVVTDPKVAVIGGNIGTLVTDSDPKILSGSYEITQADIDAGQVDNTATADSKETEPVTDKCSVSLTQKPLLTLEKIGHLVDSNNNGYTDVGDVIDYTFTVQNTGNMTLHNVVVTDPKVTVIDGAIGTLAPNTATIILNGSYAITQTDIVAGHVDNKATADSDETLPITSAYTVDLVQMPQEPPRSWFSCSWIPRNHKNP